MNIFPSVERGPAASYGAYCYIDLRVPGNLTDPKSVLLFLFLWRNVNTAFLFLGQVEISQMEFPDPERWEGGVTGTGYLWTCHEALLS